MAESFFQLKLNSKIGVWPLGLHVRTRCGFWLKAAFVNEDQRAAFRFGFFLMRGHSTCFQRVISSSLRSRARPVGRWQLQPICPINRPT